MATWQQKNPGRCARCSMRLASYNPAVAPICDRCERISSSSKTAGAWTNMGDWYENVSEDYKAIVHRGNNGKWWWSVYEFRDAEPQGAWWKLTDNEELEEDDYDSLEEAQEAALEQVAIEAEYD
jgi:hypothetical protein